MTELKTARFQVVLTPSELEAVDDWRFERRIGSRAEAIRQLIARGLTVPDEAPKPEAKKPTRPKKNT